MTCGETPEPVMAAPNAASANGSASVGSTAARSAVTSDFSKFTLPCETGGDGEGARS
jgi:hypothetical protein